METTQGSSTTESRSSGRSDYCHHKGRRHGRKFLGVLVLALAAGAVGGFVGKSFAQGHHGHGFMSLSADSDKRDVQIERMIKRFASHVDATPEQQTKLAAIAKAATQELGPVREKLRDARRQLIEITRAPIVDRAAMEKLRAEQLQLADTVSRRITQALADAADVLTPEQRQKISGHLAERMERGGHRWGRS